MVSRKASTWLVVADGFDPEQMAPHAADRVKSRDGLALNGYVTLPARSNGKGLPMVVIPHGVRSGYGHWGFEDESQILAKSGYAVLQVNFRGSSGYGRAVPAGRCPAVGPGHAG